MSFGSFALLPNITGSIINFFGLKDHQAVHEAFGLSMPKEYQNYQEAAHTTSVQNINIYFEAKCSNSLYEKSDTVQPKALVLYYVIKY